MSAAQWRRAMNSSAAAATAARRRAWRCRSASCRCASADAAPKPSADPYTWITTRLRTLRWRHAIVAAFVLAYPFFATPFFTFQIGAQSPRARVDRALAHLPRRLRRHGVARADDRRGLRRVSARDLRHQQRGGDKPRLAVVARARVRADARDDSRGRNRLALGAHRRHLHDHDHARRRRRVLLPRAAELHAVQRLPGLQQARCTDRFRHRLRAADGVLLSRTRVLRRPATFSSST